MRTATLTRLLYRLLISVLAVNVTFAHDGQLALEQLRRLEVRAVRTCRGAATFYIQTPDAAASAAVPPRLTHIRPTPRGSASGREQT